jgi:hypothetical protein
MAELDIKHLKISHNMPIRLESLGEIGMISGYLNTRFFVLFGLGCVLWLAGCRQDDAQVAAEDGRLIAAPQAWVQVDCFGDLELAKTDDLQGAKTRAYFTTRVRQGQGTNEMGKGTLILAGDRAAAELVCVVQSQKPNVPPTVVPPPTTLPSNPTIPDVITTTTLIQPTPTPADDKINSKCKPGEVMSKCGAQSLCLTPAAKAAMKCG